MKKLFQYLFSFLVCLQLVGGSSSLVQVYAWANMLVSYSAETGLVQGTVDTFSGEKPCSLCCKISKIKAEEETRQEPLSAPQVDTKHLKELIASKALDELKAPVFTDFPKTLFTTLVLQSGIPGCGPDAPPPRSLT